MTWQTLTQSLEELERTYPAVRATRQTLDDAVDELNYRAALHRFRPLPWDSRSEHPVDDIMTPGEVAKLFRVDPKTVTRWATLGLLPSFRTPGGHRRFKRADVMTLVNGTADSP